MTKEEKDLYNQKIRLYEKLGAEKFQKVVFKVEKLKYKIIKKIFPNYIKWYDSYCNLIQKRELKKAVSDEEKKLIRRKIKFAKMAMRKEINQERNRNYHMDANKPTEIYEYLKWNKQVHLKNLLINAILITISIGLSLLNVATIPVLVYELLSAFVNFECINIQNYSICKFKRCEEALKRKEQKKLAYNIENYEEVSAIIDNAVETHEELPSFSEIIDSIKDSNQLRQMKTLIQNELCLREQLKDRGKNNGSRREKRN